MTSESPVGSNNPFRRKGPAPPPPTQQPEAASLSGIFDDQLLRRSGPARGMSKSGPEPEPPSVAKSKRTKPVKKVRVQSPPPSSPETYAHPADYPAELDDGQVISGSIEDGRMSARSPQGPPPPPPNPFQTTLGDLEQPIGRTQGAISAGSQAVAPTKGSLDVASFSRLLMTGQAPVAPSQSAPSTASNLPRSAATGQQSRYALLRRSSGPSGADAGSLTDASSTSRQSLFDASQALQSVQQETPRTSHEISETDEERRDTVSSESTSRTQTSKKKPPPPSSRHGKLIKQSPSNRGTSREGSSFSPDRRVATEVDPATDLPQLSPSSSRFDHASLSDVNKPLPHAPVRRASDGPESIFDREAAGKVPERYSGDKAAGADPRMPEQNPFPTMPRRPTPPNASHAAGSSEPATGATGTPSTKKPPPPPARRPGHGRSESKAGVGLTSPTSPSYEDELGRRGSIDSIRSRSSSIRVNMGVNAPAPPPSRRPSQPSRSATGGSVASPGSMLLSQSSQVSSPGALSDSERAPTMGIHQVAHNVLPLDPVAGAGPAAYQRRERDRDVSGGSLPPKTSAPPPPPSARHTSVRSTKGRPLSVSSVEATSRRLSREYAAAAAPPPPPSRRQRDSSKGSVDLPDRPRPGAGSRRDSVDSVRVRGQALLEEAPEGEGRDDSAAKDILADLSALQREVDALRGQYEKSGPGSDAM